uniref:Lipoprotein n=1 Tax=Polynucleobacter necessarius subsp. necessarius (strain STIR1) TaxID=452638 RepID=B1XUN4_POLNS
MKANTYTSFLCLVLMLSACSVAKLEARLEANPQRKDVVNPKTGVLMPCPRSDKAFYREAGLAPAKAPPAANDSAIKSSSISATAGTASAPMMIAVPTDRKPQIHKKTGGTMPCPAPD